MTIVVDDDLRIAVVIADTGTVELGTLVRSSASELGMLLLEAMAETNRA